MFSALSYLTSIVFGTYAQKLERELNQLKGSAPATASRRSAEIIRAELERIIRDEPDSIKQACMDGKGSYVDFLTVVAASGFGGQKMILEQDVFVEGDNGRLLFGYKIDEFDESHELVVKERTGDIVVFTSEIPMVSKWMFCCVFDSVLICFCCRFSFYANCWSPTVNRSRRNPLPLR